MKIDSEYKVKREYDSICRDIASTIHSYDESTKLLTLKQVDRIIKLKSSHYKLPSIPKYSEILKFLPSDSQYKRLLRVKPVKTQSGIAVVTVMPMPYDCPHGKCIYCPGGKEYNTPLSYIGTEPATKVAQTVNYDAYEQVRTKVTQLMERGHEVSKAELVIVGGTFPYYPIEYQIEFARKCYDALNSFDGPYKKNVESDPLITSDNSEIAETTNRGHKIIFEQYRNLFQELAVSKERNETCAVRCVGFTIETKPDYCKQDHVNLMLELGTTRIELGVQALNDTIYKKVNRGHNLNDVYEAFYIARNSGYKIGAHMMPGLPASSIEQDISDSKKLFEDSRLRPDMLKIYPTLVVPNTGLYELYKKKKYESYAVEDLVNLLVEVKKIVPPWVRIMRIQREVEPGDIVSGPKMGNIRQLVLDKLKREGIKCKCIRCREIGLINEHIEFSDKDIRLERLDYEASGGKEIFLSFETKNRNLLLGFLRLRLMPHPLRDELRYGANNSHREFSYANKDSMENMICAAIVRELHVYGMVAKIGKPSNNSSLLEDYDKSTGSIRDNKLQNENNSFKFIFGDSNNVILSPESNGTTAPALSSTNAVKFQHKGLGKALLAEAERICKEEYNLKSISVISAVGTRDYYRKIGYTNNGPYVTKIL
ncbi:MAG TPA: tRNA uridine(34) 5-carboxymethylaminomethyl modification radical SAM/GNAT enzyme Elp3 [Candidatus Nitrosocosmicus sp.]|nr:tRNA uridine(34) 5-carboxymethylaminomethyl modification radical SAM/GNAT enzyme Elp3 [Candidatus Nitrosocosmicus sp.]